MKFVYQSYFLLFGDEYRFIGDTICSFFKGTFLRLDDNSAFVDGEADDLIHWKYLVLKAARIAFHFTLESFMVGEKDIGDAQIFENEVY